jgi:hypothetical protein
MSAAHLLESSLVKIGVFSSSSESEEELNAVLVGVVNDLHIQVELVLNLLRSLCTAVDLRAEVVSCCSALQRALVDLSHCYDGWPARKSEIPVKIGVVLHITEKRIPVLSLTEKQATLKKIVENYRMITDAARELRDCSELSPIDSDFSAREKDIMDVCAAVVESVAVLVKCSLASVQGAGQWSTAIAAMVDNYSVAVQDGDHAHANIVLDSISALIAEKGMEPPKQFETARAALSANICC